MAFVATKVQTGDSIDYTPVVDVPAGTVIDLGTFVGCALVDIPANIQGALEIEGIFDFVKSTSEAIGFGVACQWDDTLKRATASGAYQANIGYCVKAALAADTVVRIKLVPGRA